MTNNEQGHDVPKVSNIFRSTVPLVNLVSLEVSMGSGFSLRKIQ